jgi:hypothetical protein
MKSEMIMRRVGGSLRPEGEPDDRSWNVFDRIPNDSTVVVTVRKSRNPQHLAKYWVLCGFVARFDKEYDHQEDIDDWLRLSIPWMREEIVLGDGRVRVKTKSINLDEMEQLEFDRFYERAVELLSMRLGRDVEQALREEQPR